MLDASGLIHIDGARFLVAEDETDVLRFFSFNSDGLIFTAGGRIEFGRSESDFESLAYDPGSRRYYCIGSHSADYSQRLLGFGLNGLDAVNVAEISFDANRLAGKKVDIEALSVHDSRLFIGFRRPMRSNRALAVMFDINSGAQVMTSFDLAGRSFRDVVRIDDTNYLILAGPEKGGDYEDLPSSVFWWNGSLFTPEIRSCGVDLRGFRAEGVAVRQLANGPLEVFVGSDESKIPGARCFRLLYLQGDDVQGVLGGRVEQVELDVEL